MTRSPSFSPLQHTMTSLGHQDLAIANSEPILHTEDRVNTDRVSHKQTDEEVFLIPSAQGKRPLEEDESTPCQEVWCRV
jgi:hypothetical protein